MVIRVTLDTNCIIKALNPSEVDHDLVQELIHLHRVGEVEIQLVVVNASENGRNLAQLKWELEKLRLKGIRQLDIPMILGFSYLDHSYLINEEDYNHIGQIWSVIFPKWSFDHDEFCRQYKKSKSSTSDEDINSKWRNKMCDSLTIYEYMRDCRKHRIDNDINLLVTADENDIVRRRDKLAEQGIKSICAVREALEKLI